jgi:hypothetical protein
MRDMSWHHHAFILDLTKTCQAVKKSLALSAYPVESAGDEALGRSTEFTKALSNHSKRWFEYSYLLLQMAGTKVVWNIQESYICGWEER